MLTISYLNVSEFNPAVHFDSQNFYFKVLEKDRLV